MYSECIGETSGSDSVSILNRGTDPMISFRLGFCKGGLVLPVSIMGMVMGSVLCSSVFKYGSWWRRTWVNLLELWCLFICISFTGGCSGSGGV